MIQHLGADLVTTTEAMEDETDTTEDMTGVMRDATMIDMMDAAAAARIVVVTVMNALDTMTAMHPGAIVTPAEMTMPMTLAARYSLLLKNVPLNTGLLSTSLSFFCFSLFGVVCQH